MLKVCFPPHQEMKVQPTDPTGSTSASRDSFRGSLWAWFIYNCAVGCSRWWPHMASIASTAVEHMQWRNPSTVNEPTVKGAMWPPPRWCLCCADPPAKPPLRLRCRQGRFYKWKRESFHFTPTPSSLYCENLLCAGRNHIISTHTLDICHYATRCCNKTSNWIVLKTVKFGGAGRGGGGMRSKSRDPCALLGAGGTARRSRHSSAWLTGSFGVVPRLQQWQKNLCCGLSAASAIFTVKRSAWRRSGSP